MAGSRAHPCVARTQSLPIFWVWFYLCWFHSQLFPKGCIYPFILPALNPVKIGVPLPSGSNESLGIDFTASSWHDHRHMHLMLARTGSHPTPRTPSTQKIISHWSFLPKCEFPAAWPCWGSGLGLRAESHRNGDPAQRQTGCTEQP